MHVLRVFVCVCVCVCVCVHVCVYVCVHVCASKWAIEGMTKAVAQELPPPLVAMPVSPGIVDTDSG